MPGAFTPEINPVITPSDTVVSQGPGVNQSFSKLFSGLDQTADNLVSIKDQQNTIDIRQEADQMFNKINSDFGLGDPTNTPAGVSSGVGQMQNLQNALAQGKISEVNYYGRLANISKTLRSQYPGYEQVIDQQIYGITGVKPGNAYRNALFQQIQLGQWNQNQQQRMNQEYDKQNAGVLFSLYGQDYFTNNAQYDRNKVEADVAQFKSGQLGVESQLKSLQLNAAQGTANATQATKVISQDFGQTVNAVLNHTTGVNTPNGMSQIDQFIQQGGPKNPQDLEQFTNNISMMESQVRNTLYQRGMSQYVTKGLMSQADMNKAVDAAMYPIEQAKEAVLGKNYTLASKFSTLGKAEEDFQVQQTLKDPTMAAGAGLTKIDQTLGQHFWADTHRQDHAVTVAQEVAGRSMLGQPDVIKNTVQVGNDKLSQNVLQQSFKIMTDPKVQGQDFSNMFDQYFGQKALDFMDPKVVASKDIGKIYNTFLNPDMTKAVFAKGTPEEQQQYTQWALSKFSAIPEIRAMAGNTSSFLPDGAKLEYDPQANRVALDLSGVKQHSWAYNMAIEPLPSVVGNSMAANTRTAAASVRSMNQALASLDPIIRANGQTGEAVTLPLLKQLGVPISGMGEESADQKKYEAQRPLGVQDLDFSKPQGSSLSDTLHKVGKALTGDIHTGLFVPPEQDKAATAFLVPRIVGHTAESVEGMQPGFRDRLAALFQNAPSDIQKGLGIYSGYRSPEHQAQLFDAALTKYGSVQEARRWVSPPPGVDGSKGSRHNMGLAADLSYNGASLQHAPAPVVEWLHENASRFGLHFPLSNENWHIEPIGAR